METERQQKKNMKINQKQLNEMIRKSILKRLNEDVQGTSDDLQSRMDKIKWYFETPTYLLKNKGKQNDNTNHQTTNQSNRFGLERRHRLSTI